jgi:hypothetical protein
MTRWGGPYVWASVNDLPCIDPGVLVLDWLDPKVRWLVPDCEQNILFLNNLLWLVLDCESVLGLCVRAAAEGWALRMGAGAGAGTSAERVVSDKSKEAGFSDLAMDKATERPPVK